MESEKEKSYWQIREHSWKDAINYSDYRALLQLKEAIKQKNWESADQLVNELVDDTEGFQKVQIWNTLKDLMYWQIRWQAQPEIRTHETVIEIFRLLDEFGYIFFDNPNLGKDYIETIWDETYKDAIYRASTFTPIFPEKLTWEAVFEFDYKSY